MAPALAAATGRTRDIARTAAANNFMFPSAMMREQIDHQRNTPRNVSREYGTRAALYRDLQSMTVLHLPHADCSILRRLVDCFLSSPKRCRSPATRQSKKRDTRRQPAGKV